MPVVALPTQPADIQAIPLMQDPDSVCLLQAAPPSHVEQVLPVFVKIAVCRCKQQLREGPKQPSLEILRHGRIHCWQDPTHLALLHNCVVAGCLPLRTQVSHCWGGAGHHLCRMRQQSMQTGFVCAALWLTRILNSFLK